MAASPASDGPFGGRIVEGQGGSIASYDGERRRFAFLPPTDDDDHIYAIDVEERREATTLIPAILTGDVLARWGELEVMAKLTDQSAHFLLIAERRGRLAEQLGNVMIEFVRADTATHRIVVGRRRKA